MRGGASLAGRLGRFLREEAAKPPPSLSDVDPDLRAALDTPWLLLLVVPALLLAPGLLPDAVILPKQFLLALATLAAARRWGLDALAPTLVLCLLNLVHLPMLPGFGNIWMVPVLLAMARLGADPSFIAAIRQYDRLGPADLSLVLAMLLSTFVLTGFQPHFAIVSDPQGLPALLLFALLGASKVRFRPLLMLLLVAVAANWVLAPLRPLEVVRSFLNYDLGIKPVDAAAYSLAFFAARVTTRPYARSSMLALGAAALWLAMLGIATTQILVELPFGPFGENLRSIRWGSEAGPRLVSARQVLVRWDMVVLQAVIASQLLAAERPRFLPSWRRAGETIFSLIAVAMTVIGTIDILGGWDFPRIGLIVAPPGTVADGYDLAIRAASLALLSALAVGAARRWRAGADRLDEAARLSRPLPVELLGRFWAYALPAQFLILATVSFGFALVDPLPTLEGLAQSFSDPASRQADNVALEIENVANRLDRLEAEADNLMYGDENLIVANAN